MFRTKEGIRRSLSRTLRVLVPGLCIASLGCADTGGLRSVWPDRPIVAGLLGPEAATPARPGRRLLRPIHARRQGTVRPPGEAHPATTRTRPDRAATTTRRDRRDRAMGCSPTNRRRLRRRERPDGTPPRPKGPPATRRSRSPWERPSRSRPHRTGRAPSSPQPPHRSGRPRGRRGRHRRHRRSRTPGRSSTVARPSSSRWAPIRSRCRGSNGSTAACSPRKRSS